eukprot:Amastigsp_a841513_98.p7 type:complete len:109 gc:universal Amastigsp_a841513_98:844-1170(+)
MPLALSFAERISTEQSRSMSPVSMSRGPLPPDEQVWQTIAVWPMLNVPPWFGYTRIVLELRDESAQSRSPSLSKSPRAASESDASEEIPLAPAIEFRRTPPAAAPEAR